MRSFVTSVRGFAIFISFVMCLILSFKGFPLALVSWLGMFILMTGYGVAFSTMFHTNEDSPTTGIGKFFLVCVEFAVASFGGAVIIWAGLTTINIVERSRESVEHRRKTGGNLGGRPKTSNKKESLVLRLRKEGESYRSIKEQTGLALATITRIIKEQELVKC